MKQRVPRMVRPDAAMAWSNALLSFGLKRDAGVWHGMRGRGGGEGRSYAQGRARTDRRVRRAGGARAIRRATLAGSDTVRHRVARRAVDRAEDVPGVLAAD